MTPDTNPKAADLARLQRELQQREREFEAINRHALVSITDQAGRIQHANALFCDTSGFTLKELRGQGHDIIGSGTHSREFFRDLWATLARGEIWSGEMCNRRKDGELYWVTSTITPFLDERGRPYQYVSICTDITSAKLAEANQRRQHRVERMVSELSANLATAVDQAAVDPVLQRFLQESGEHLGADRAYLLLYSDDGERMNMTHEWCADGVSSKWEVALDLPVAAFPWWQQQMTDNRVTLLPDVSRLPASASAEKDIMTAQQALSVAGIPLLINGRLQGCIGYDSVRARREWRDQDVTLLAVIGDAISNALTRFELRREAQQHRERLRLGQLYADIGTWEWNLQTDAMYWTEPVARLFGIPETVLRGDKHQFLGAVHPDDRAAITAAMRDTIRDDKPYRLEHRVLRADGSVRWLQQSAAVNRDEHGVARAMIGITQDIHDRKLAELALKENERELRKTQQMARLGSWEEDCRTGEITWSSIVYEILGLPVADTTPGLETLGTLIDREDRDMVTALRQQLHDTGAGVDVVLRIVRPDAEVRHVHLLAKGETDSAGTPVRIRGTVQDITRLKQAEEDLLVIRRVFDATSQAIGVTDASGNLIFSNRAHEETLGYDHEECLGMYFDAFIPAENRDWVADAVTRALEQGKTWSGLLPLLRKDGSEVLTLSDIGIIQSEDERRQYLFNIFSDYTPEQKRQQELALAREEAEQASQAKSTFLSSMSHELRTPMNSILGFAQLLEYDPALGQEQLDNVQEILRAGGHLLTLINDILDLARVESGQIPLALQPVPILPLVEECMSLLASQAEAGNITLNHLISADSSVRADRTRLKQALLNLLSNAIKYNRNGGDVRVTANSHGEDRVRIAVMDTGRGIPTHRLAELFQSFNRLDAEKTSVEGTGIGLFITRRLLQMMEGSVGVSSEVGSGSTFWLELPRASVATRSNDDTVTPAEDAATAKHESRHRVLYIEDNPANLKLVTQIMERHGIELVGALLPRDGIALALASPPDLILLDINMPEMDGYEVLATLRETPTLTSVPIIAVTANAMHQEVEQGMQAGFNDYITKPIQVGQFLATLEHWLHNTEKAL
ncbi:MAG: PAS domain S-box protein [Haliea sp.]